jgi:hypothetical protein
MSAASWEVVRSLLLEVQIRDDHQHFARSYRRRDRVRPPVAVKAPNSAAPTGHALDEGVQKPGSTHTPVITILPVLHKSRLLA